MQIHCQPLCILRAAPAQGNRQLLSILIGQSGQEPVLLDQFPEGIHDRLFDADLRIVGILDLQTQPAPIPELVEGEACEPGCLILDQQITELPYHLCLVIGAGYIPVRIKLGHDHGLCHAAVEEPEPFKTALGHLIGLRHSTPVMAGAARLCHVIGPAPVQRHVFVHGPDIRCRNGLGKFLFHFNFLLVGMLHAADANDYGYVGGFLLDDPGSAHKEIRYLLIGAALVEGKPVTGGFMVDPQQHSAEGAQILADLCQHFIGNMRIDGESQGHILTMGTDLPHVAEGFPLCAAADAALIGEIVIVGVIPGKAYVRAGVNHTCPTRPAFVQRVVAVHQTDAPHGTPQLGEDIVLVYIFAPFAAVSQVNGAVGFPHMNFIKIF